MNNSSFSVSLATPQSLQWGRQAKFNVSDFEQCSLATDDEIVCHAVSLILEMQSESEARTIAESKKWHNIVVSASVEEESATYESIRGGPCSAGRSLAMERSPLPDLIAFENKIIVPLPFEFAYNSGWRINTVLQNSFCIELCDFAVDVPKIGNATLELTCFIAKKNTRRTVVALGETVFKSGDTTIISAYILQNASLRYIYFIPVCDRARLPAYDGNLNAHVCLTSQKHKLTDTFKCDVQQWRLALPLHATADHAAERLCALRAYVWNTPPEWNQILCNDAFDGEVTLKLEFGDAKQLIINPILIYDVPIEPKSSDAQRRPIVVEQSITTLDARIKALEKTVGYTLK